MASGSGGFGAFLTAYSTMVGINTRLASDDLSNRPPLARSS
jgi:hypothetical protein